MQRASYRVAILALLSTGFSMVCFRATAARADDAAVQPIRALLVTGGCCHDYSKQKDIITQGISARANVEWTIAFDPDRTTTHLNSIYQNDDWAKGFDVI